MSKQESKPVKVEGQKQDDENLNPVPLKKCCILRIGTNGLSLVGGVYESEKAALGSLQKAGAAGDFILLPVTTL